LYPTITYDFLDGNFSNFFKKLKIFVEKYPIYEEFSLNYLLIGNPSKNYQGCM
jgi:hypothetical protein